MSAIIGGKRYRVTEGNKKFWHKVTDNQWEPHTFAALERYLHADSVYLDIGAWIGPTVLFAAPRCKTVHCVEPDPVAYERLLTNLRINDIDNVLPFHGALGSRNGTVQIANAEDFGNSETRVQSTPNSDSIRVLALDIFSLIEFWSIDKIDVLKMDVEGAEFDLVPSLITLLPRIKPTIHLSLHAPLFPHPDRPTKLASIIELAKHYTFCYDKHLAPIPPKEILNAPFTNKFATVLLTDTAL